MPSRKDQGTRREDDRQEVPGTLPDLRNPVVAIIASCFHLSDHAPPARAEHDWMATQAGYLDYLASLCDRYGQVPLITPGDLFDRWDVSPETINLAMKHLPPVTVAIPGNHDLPYHSYEQMHRSAYGVLVEANRIITLEPGEPYRIDDTDILLHGFPFGSTPEDVVLRQFGTIDVAVIHSYCWMGEATHPGAKAEDEVGQWLKRLSGYKSLIFGDNHHFVRFPAQPRLLNCGCFIRRKSDERRYQSVVGLLMSDGQVDWKTTTYQSLQEKWADVSDKPAELPDFSAYIDEMSKLTDQSINYAERVKAMLKGLKAGGEVIRITHDALGE